VKVLVTVSDAPTVTVTNANEVSAQPSAAALYVVVTVGDTVKVATPVVVEIGVVGVDPR
jgi:hypothetical protein